MIETNFDKKKRVFRQGPCFFLLSDSYLIEELASIDIFRATIFIIYYIGITFFSKHKMFYFKMIYDLTKVTNTNEI